MTYFNFLLLFVIIPISVLLLTAWLDLRRGSPSPAEKGNEHFNFKKFPLILIIHVILALVYTTPWDNYLVATGVWYYNPALVTGLTLGYVPIEEYTFFVVETVLSGLWWYFLARRLPHPAPETFRPNRLLVALSGSCLLLLWGFFSFQFFFGPAQWNYLGIIFFWALPAILPQLLFGADLLWHYRQLIFWSILIPGLYLSLTDILALRAATWSISPAQTLGIRFFGILPLEEVAFFFITNTLISFGMTLMLSTLGWQRFAAWKVRGFRGLP
ncbi:MAG: lycopene cyclase domain-containing protein [Anaerolineales bacterium]